MILLSAIENTAAFDVVTERRRQVTEEHNPPGRDDFYRQGELANAAASYIMPPASRMIIHGHPWNDAMPPRLWPWDAPYWKPGGGGLDNRRRQLVKGAALALAEIERIDREIARLAVAP